jgi:hypothetical protein
MTENSMGGETLKFTVRKYSAKMKFELRTGSEVFQLQLSENLFNASRNQRQRNLYFFMLLKASSYVAIIVEARYMRFFRNIRGVLLTCFEMCFTPTLRETVVLKYVLRHF